MKKFILIISVSAFALLFGGNLSAQRGFFDLNVSYNKFTQHLEKEMGSVDAGFEDEEDIDWYNLNSKETDKDHITALNINVGYNFRIDEQCYLGFYLGYTNYKGEQLGNTATLFSFAPHLTYMIPISKKFIYTPNCYASIGYGTTSAGTVSVSAGPFSQSLDLGNITKLNFRFGISPFSFDFKLSDAASFNLTLLTPQLNVMKYSYDAADYNQTTKDVVFLYGQAGFKLYLNKKDASQTNNKNRKRRK